MGFILLVVLLILVLGGGGGFYGYRTWGVHGGIGVPAVVVIILVIWLFSRNA
jgi:hypothetical protein